jgi:hypothetical protein
MQLDTKLVSVRLSRDQKAETGTALAVPASRPTTEAIGGISGTSS